MLDAIYDEMRACVAALRAAGQASDAEALDTALYGATLGEILTDLGFHLSTIVGSSAGLSDDLRGRLGNLLAEVDRILKAAGQA